MPLPRQCESQPNFSAASWGLDQPLIFEVLETELEGIDAKFRGHDIDVRLPGKGICVDPRGPPWSRAERMSPGNTRIVAMGGIAMVRYVINLLDAPGAGKIGVKGPENDLPCSCSS
jgi:hypothetical protein